MHEFSRLMTQISNCRLCESELPLGVNPVLIARPQAKILIVGQAPGRRVHETGIPFNDPSGDRLRHWLGVTREQFYTAPEFSIVPMGFCYPGKGKSGDLPPPKLCAPTWRESLLTLMPNISLTILLGTYAQRYHLNTHRKKTLTETVQAWREYWPHYLPLPHPSPRNIGWLKRNPWLEYDLMPVLRLRVNELMDTQHGT